MIFNFKHLLLIFLFDYAKSDFLNKDQLKAFGIFNPPPPPSPPPSSPPPSSSGSGSISSGSGLSYNLSGSGGSLQNSSYSGFGSNLGSLDLRPFLSNLSQNINQELDKIDLSFKTIFELLLKDPTQSSKSNVTVSKNSSSSSSNLETIITKWKTSNGSGYKGIKADVTSISYDNYFVYISTNSIPSYSIGPWSNNPNDATAQNLVYKFNRSPSFSSVKSKMNLGPIGLWINGVTIFNGWDGLSYNK